MPHGIHQSPHNHSGTPQHIQETNSLASDDVGVIYGTNINSKHVIDSLENFVLTFEEVKLIEGE